MTKEAIIESVLNEQNIVRYRSYFKKAMMAAIEQYGLGEYVQNLENKIGQKNKRIIELTEFLKAHEQWEADFISDNSMWWPNANNDALRGRVYESFLELQSKRNALLNSEPNPERSVATKAQSRNT